MDPQFQSPGPILSNGQQKVEYLSSKHFKTDVVQRAFPLLSVAVATTWAIGWIHRRGLIAF